MPDALPYAVFLSHSAKDKAVVRPLAERLRQDGLKVWFGQWATPVAATRQSAANSSTELMREEEDGGALPRRRYAEKIEEGLEHSRVLSLAHRMGEGGRRPGEGSVANAFGSDWAQLLIPPQPSTHNPQPTSAPLNQERRFIPLRLDDGPIRGSLARFLCINWRPTESPGRIAALESPEINVKN
jgi:hypothetical protein